MTTTQPDGGGSRDAAPVAKTVDGVYRWADDNTWLARCLSCGWADRFVERAARDAAADAHAATHPRAPDLGPDPGSLVDGAPLTLRGERAELESPASLTAAAVALTKAREDDRKAAEEAARQADAEQRRAYRAQFAADILEAAALLGIDPAEVLRTEVTADGIPRITTRRGIYEHHGDVRQWHRVGDLATSDAVGPFGLALTKLTEQDMTEDERAELDRYFPPWRPNERAEVFRSSEGLVVGDGRPDSKMRTLLPGTSGRAEPVGLMHPDDWPPAVRAGRERRNIWAGPGTGLPEPSAAGSRSGDAERRDSIEPADAADDDATELDRRRRGRLGGRRR